MPKVFQPTFIVILLSLCVVACSKKSEPAPTQKPAAADSTGATQQAPAQAPHPAPEASNFTGEWTGSSGENLPISFSVEGSQISNLNASYAGKIGTCSVNGSIGSDGPSPINGKSFTSRGKTENGPLEFTVNGAFSSATEASGTLVWKGSSGLCGDIDFQYKWMAKKSAPE